MKKKLRVYKNPKVHIPGGRRMISLRFDPALLSALDKIASRNPSLNRNKLIEEAVAAIIKKYSRRK